MGARVRERSRAHACTRVRVGDSGTRTTCPRSNRQSSVISSAERPFIPALLWLACCPAFRPVCAPGTAGFGQTAVLFTIPSATVGEVRMVTTVSFSQPSSNSLDTCHFSSLTALPLLEKDVGDRGAVVGIGSLCQPPQSVFGRLAGNAATCISLDEGTGWPSE